MNRIGSGPILGILFIPVRQVFAPSFRLSSRVGNTHLVRLLQMALTLI